MSVLTDSERNIIVIIVAALVLLLLLIIVLVVPYLLYRNRRKKDHKTGMHMNGVYNYDCAYLIVIIILLNISKAD